MVAVNVSIFWYPYIFAYSLLLVMQNSLCRNCSIRRRRARPSIAHKALHSAIPRRPFLVMLKIQRVLLFVARIELENNRCFTPVKTKEKREVQSLMANTRPFTRQGQKYIQIKTKSTVEQYEMIACFYKCQNLSNNSKEGEQTVFLNQSLNCMFISCSFK